MLSILYKSSVDVSIIGGPSANEREFIPCLDRVTRGTAHFIIPKPLQDIPSDLPVAACSFTRSPYQKKPHQWFLHQLSTIRIANRVIRENRFDMIVTRAGAFPLAACYLTRKHPLPYALKTAGAAGFPDIGRTTFLHRFIRALNLKLFKNLAYHSFMIDVVSPEQKEKLVARTGIEDKIVHIDNGANTNRFTPGSMTESRQRMRLTQLDPIIGYAGSLPWIRGAKQIIQALPKLKDNFPDIGALIVGSGPNIHRLYEEAKRLNVFDRCVFTQQVPYETVPDYLRCMDLCVSQRYGSAQCASELKVRQYLACGKPVIVSPGKANDFVEREKLGCTVDSCDQESFNTAAHKLLSLNENERQSMQEKARTYAVEHLSYESKVRERLKLWSDKLDSSKT